MGNWNKSPLSLFGLSLCIPLPEKYCSNIVFITMPVYQNTPAHSRSPDLDFNTPYFSSLLPPQASIFLILFLWFFHKVIFNFLALPVMFLLAFRQGRGKESGLRKATGRGKEGAEQERQGEEKERGGEQWGENRAGFCYCRGYLRMDLKSSSSSFRWRQPQAGNEHSKD